MKEKQYNPGWEANEESIKGVLSEIDKEKIKNSKNRSTLNKYYIYIPIKSFVAFFTDKSKLKEIKDKYIKHFKLTKKDIIITGFNKSRRFEKFK